MQARELAVNFDGRNAVWLAIPNVVLRIHFFASGNPIFTQEET